MNDSVATSSTPVLRLPTLREQPPRTALGRFFLGEHRLDQEEQGGRTYSWTKVLWLTGVDYFSTLGYQPGIALLAAGALSVPATAILIAVTLFAAVPVYSEVAKRSYVGQGSIALLENLLSGWKSKIFVLILLGFAATDFVITMTLSAADAAHHAIANPSLHRLVGDSQILVTLALLFLLAVVFFVGFREAIGLAQIVAVPYLVLNLIVLLRGLWEVARHPETIHAWRLGLVVHGDWTAMFIVSALLFPKLALGLSGFETGVSVMPLISNDSPEKDEQIPTGRIKATRYLLLTAGALMSVMLLLSSAVTSLLIPPAAYQVGGPAAGRAIAYLAHTLLGDLFGTIYDFSTILILWFAGASAMAGLLNLIPRYLPRFGMAPRWVAYRRPLVLVLLGIDLVITLIFRASVEAQGGAYATGVLVLMLSAAVAVTIARARECELRKPLTLLLVGYFFFVSLVFVFTLGDNVLGRPDGILIATTFILLLLIASAVSRSVRSTEMRISAVTFADEESAELWKSITGKKVNLIPHQRATALDRNVVEEKLRKHYVLTGPLAFLHVHLQDNRSEFLSTLRVFVRRDGEDYVIGVRGAVAVANAIAYLSELLDPISILLGLTNKNLMKQSVSYLFWGEGETALLAYTILVRYWEWTQRTADRPRIFLMSG
ncbi:MAG TPA: hypothetical protein VMJ35_16480 [Dongiaceae bacterium]|nr:hypothetical protein [Dongiaceae bacterium]